MNSSLVDHLNKIADYYVVANDNKRSRAFRSAARNFALISFEIDRSNLKDVNFQGLGESILHEVRDFLNGKDSVRLSSLQEEFPPITALSLLNLFNFDLEYIYYLWKNFHVFTVEDLFSISERRVQIALSIRKKMNISPTTLPTETHYNLLGDCIVHTAYGTGKRTVDEIAEKLVELGDKHIFIADYLESPNVLGGVSVNRLVSQSQAIKRAQIDHNVRIFHGTIVDVDLDGDLIMAEDALGRVEYIVIKLSTQPHLKVLSRLDKALTYLQERGFKNIIIDCLDHYVEFAFQKRGLESLLLKYKVVLNLFGQNAEERSIVASFLKGINLARVSLSSFSTDYDDFDNLFKSAEIATFLQIPQESIINSLPHPFKNKISKNQIGVRDDIEEEDVNQQESLEDRLRYTMNRIQELQKVGNRLGSVLKGKNNE